MVDELRHEHDDGREPDPADIVSGHEHSDASIPGLIAFLIGLAVSLVVVVFAIAWMFNSLVERSDRQDPPPAALAELRSGRPPAPRLQEAPKLDMQALRATQFKNLSEINWIDQQAGIVRMPIKQAMEHVASGKTSNTANDDLPRTEQTSQGLPKWPREASDPQGDAAVKPKDSTPPPGTGKNPEAQPRESIKEDQPSDVPASKQDDEKSEKE